MGTFRHFIRAGFFLMFVRVDAFRYGLRRMALSNLKFSNKKTESLAGKMKASVVPAMASREFMELVDQGKVGRGSGCYSRCQGEAVLPRALAVGFEFI